MADQRKKNLTNVSHTQERRVGKISFVFRRRVVDDRRLPFSRYTLSVTRYPQRLFLLVIIVPITVRRAFMMNQENNGLLRVKESREKKKRNKYTKVSGKSQKRSVNVRVLSFLFTKTKYIYIYIRMKGKVGEVSSFLSKESPSFGGTKEKEKKKNFCRASACKSNDALFLDLTQRNPFSYSLESACFWTTKRARTHRFPLKRVFFYVRLQYIYAYYIYTYT